MKEQSFIVKTADIRTAAAKAVLALTHEPVMEVIVRPHLRNRTDGQNRRYWATITEELRLIGQTVDFIAQQTGYSPLEVRRLCAKELPPEQIALLYCHSEEAAHDILKTIHGIKTSTRLGTKQFMEFEERMLQTLAEVRGAVQAVAREAE